MLIIVINVITVAVALLVNPILYSWTAGLKYDVQSESFYVVITGEGWVAPPPRIDTRYVDVKLIIGNATMDLTRVDLTIDVYPVVFDFNVSRVFKSEEFNVSVFPDVKLYVDIRGYVPFPASVITVLNNGCYLLLYYLPEQLNTTVNLCYYYVNPTLTIFNEESGDVEVLLELHKGDGSTTMEQYVVKQKSTRSIQFNEIIRPLVREEKLKYMFFEVVLEDGKPALRLLNVLHVLIVAWNSVSVFIALVLCKSSKRTRKVTYRKAVNR